MARFLSTEQRTLLNAILDRLIPATCKMQGAGQAGTADHIDGVAGASPRMGRLFTAGLRSIESAAARRGVAFIDMSSDQQDEILRGIEANKSAFFETLLLHTYNGYYSNPQVVEVLGLEPRPPQPRGHEVAVGDFNSLATVVERGIVYRET